ncbi:MAG: hypothetical protein EA403_09490 [Spirochaetaceae bacterium]|nr:MAG: hypothetical protein EA403_09490 [Spirochaetaceae bacterium]
MAIQIHYDDDLYLVQLMIKTLGSAVRLDLDPDLFAGKLVEDIDFIDGTIQALFRRLRESDRLLRRMEYLRSVLRAKHALVETIDTCLQPESPLHEALSPSSGRLRAIRIEHRDDCADIEALLSRGDEDDSDDGELVSHEEIASLLQPDDDTP